MKKLAMMIVFLFATFFVFAKDITIYHTSDTHGFFYSKQNMGGYAILASVLQSGPQDYLLLDSGDFSNGTLEAKNSKGIKSIALMNAMGYDAATIGNHEFDFKEKGFPNILEKASFPILAANFVDVATKDFPNGVLPYKIYNVSGVKVAVLGLANSKPNSSVTKYEFLDPLESLEKYLPEVEKQNPNVVAVILHDSIADDKHGTKSYVSEIATRFGGRIHIVLGGHAHKIFQNKFINRVLFVESGNHLKGVSRVVISIDDSSNFVKKIKSSFIELDASKFPADRKIEILAESLREPGIDISLGNLEYPIKKEPIKGYLDSEMDKVIADAETFLVKRYMPSVDIVVHNVTGARKGLEKGSYTERDLIDIFPYDDTMKIVKVKGAFIRKLISKSILPFNRFSFNGLTAEVAFPTDFESAKEISDLRIKIGNEDLIDTKEYTIAVNEFIAEGGSEGYLFKEIPTTDKEDIGNFSVREALRTYLSEYPAVGHNIKKGSIRVVKKFNGISSIIKQGIFKKGKNKF